MNFTPIIAALRHAGSYAAGAATILAFTGMAPEDARKLADAAVDASKSFADVLAAVSVATPIIMAAWSSFKSTTKSQVKAVQSSPDFNVVPVTDKGQATLDAVEGKT